MECRYPEFGDYLRKHRAKLGKSQRAIAADSPVSNGRIGQLEAGAGLPSWRHVKGLDAAYEADEQERSTPNATKPLASRTERNTRGES